MNRRSLLSLIGLAPVAIPAAAMRMPDRPAVAGDAIRSGLISPDDYRAAVGWGRDLASARAKQIDQILADINASTKQQLEQIRRLADDTKAMLSAKPLPRKVRSHVTITDKAGNVVFTGTSDTHDIALSVEFEDRAA